ncbi:MULTISPECIES: NADH-quinone oxidoreductase subunit E [Rhodobacterales]|jgi:NADH-quinone oxidoreductase subunit E|uniref:NADH-quinone oxidoreductase subunit E n=1 Tax=Rhodobacterales TaxID=204455 RepID=UPI00237F48C0|nr:NADH-quinone oxidoreductase subunit E [Phaeobacter gallaeciensis]MDE4138842.1 NADH-quinone oxidoreductase subunit E [Phaeobacter gallaeciensis]MDE4148100.1 NADH-quinone oxidoreductase subunit E [Phaeobacter gallaeciensis]MDE4152318.1 NADH-quinone oxidoreductase subunit E [Phaeobacter gallaeciensis]MDE4226898.1 NADH-quinone oxidoreductase subunit E [Phaeobacter gallaeciensis]MDE4256782.1 NADH-quinone oxidoreductase subunit E [Phaeobacter gallaeciensis]
MLRRLHSEQPESFAFTPDNQKWAEAQLTKYPEGRQASAVIPLLWRAQEQEGWVTKPAIEYIADMLGMAYIRVLEVASFYFMFQLVPTGSVAHVQVCGTTSCMICGAEDLIAVCKEKIAPKPHTVSADGKFSWEEVECLGSCTNAPMAQIGKDYFEDLTTESFTKILDDLAAGNPVVPGPQNGRYAAEPKSGLTSLTEYDSGKTQYNASVQLAVDLGDSVKRIQGDEVPILTPWVGKDGVVAGRAAEGQPPKAPEAAKPAAKQAAEAKPAPKKAPAKKAAEPASPEGAAAKSVEESAPETLSEARGGKADDLKMLKGVGPKLEETLNELGFFHFDQIAKWTEAEIAWVDSRLKFKGRIERDGWIEQSKQLAAGEETEFAKKAKDDGRYED